jgi:hypothetical protein
MGYKIRDDAPRSLSLPVPVGGGDFSPTTNERIYEPGQPIEVITTDIVERFESGDPHLVEFIEEIVEIDTQEIEPQPAPGDGQLDSVPEIAVTDNGPQVVTEPVVPADLEPVAAETPVEVEVPDETVVNDEPVAEAPVPSDDNPFAAQ